MSIFNNANPFGLAAGALDGGFKIFNGIKQLGQAGKIKPQYTPYTISPYAQQQLGIAQQLFNGRMAGAGAMENNIGTSQASTIANAQRNATDGAQALVAGNAAQANANSAYNQLAIQEAQNKQAMLGNLNQALGAMTNENDKVYQDRLQKYQQDLQMKASFNAGGMTNIGNGINAIGSGAIMGAMNGGTNSYKKKNVSNETIPIEQTPKIIPTAPTMLSGSPTSFYLGQNPFKYLNVK